MSELSGTAGRPRRLRPAASNRRGGVTSGAPAASGVLLLVLAAAGSLPTPAAQAAHPFHETVTEIEFNAARQCYELAVKAYPEELEAAVTAAQRRRFLLAAPDAKERLVEYLKRALEVRWGDQPGDLEWVGMEVAPDAVWLYVQWNRPADAQGAAQLKNRLLFELYDDQSNLVVRRLDGVKRAVTLSPAQWSLDLAASP